MNYNESLNLNVTEKIVQLIEEVSQTSESVTPSCDLYKDLGLNSLMFVCLILKIEEAFSISFELTEIGQALKVDALVATVERKIKG